MASKVQKRHFLGPAKIKQQPNGKRPLHHVICSTSVIGLFFFAGTVDHKKYIKVLEKFLTKAQKEKQIDEHRFMQNGAAPHRHKDVLSLPNRKFENRVIALGTCFAWPLYFPDLNPYDFFLWGYLKDSVFRGDTLNLDPLKKRTAKASKTITGTILHSVFFKFCNSS